MVVLAFCTTTAAILFLGPRLARVVETIADRLGIGQVLVGAVLLGAVTSLPGLVLTVTAATRGDAELAVANALGGVAVQTVFIAIADVAYRAGTLSNGVETREVAFQGALLMVMLSLVVIGLGTDTVTVGPVHPISALIVAAYVVGLWLSRGVERSPALVAGDSEASIDRDPDAEGARSGLRGKLGELEEHGPSARMQALQRRSTGSLWVRFAVLASSLAACGFVLAWAGSTIADRTALSATSVGVLLTSVATSTPELVTAVSAARSGAIGLAAGDIIGGNVFDTLFIAAADIVGSGSVFALAGPSVVFLAGLAMLLNAVLLAGLVRQGTGTHDVGAESLMIVVVWIVGVVVILV